MLSDLDRLRAMLTDAERPVQLVFAGKAHPADREGQEVIRRLVLLTQGEFRGKLVFLEDYDIEMGRMLVQGCDVWLNTPRRPQEAAAPAARRCPINGGVNLSILDGWWAEGFRGDNGWAIGDERGRPGRAAGAGPRATRSRSTACSRTRWSRASSTATPTACPGTWIDDHEGLDRLGGARTSAPTAWCADYVGSTLPSPALPRAESSPGLVSADASVATGPAASLRPRFVAPLGVEEDLVEALALGHHAADGVSAGRVAVETQVGQHAQAWVPSPVLNSSPTRITKTAAAPRGSGG